MNVHTKSSTELSFLSTCLTWTSHSTEGTDLEHIRHESSPDDFAWGLFDGQAPELIAVEKLERQSKTSLEKPMTRVAPWITNSVFGRE